MTAETVADAMALQLATPWMQFFLAFDPKSALEHVKCPVLAINGELDLQVPAEDNINAISEALKKAKNKDVTTQILPGLNHLFQECETGAPSEYARIDQTFSPSAMNEISDWILQQVNQ